jgi:N6-L-threonylcarbamoyladenine synthase
MHGHIAANYLEHHDLEPPFMSLVVSGGHTNIVNVPDYNRCEKIGGTRDDAAGEAFDKVARVIGLGYPGGPKVDKAAKEGNRNAIDFKRVWLEPGSYDFSFSGLKTFAVNLVHNASQKGEEVLAEDLGASFIKSVTDILVKNTIAAAEDNDIKQIVLAGGVSANSRLRRKMREECEKRGFKLYMPELKYCGDNAAMVGAQGYYEYLGGKRADLKLNAVASMPITEKV